MQTFNSFNNLLSVALYTSHNHELAGTHLQTNELMKLVFLTRGLRIGA